MSVVHESICVMELAMSLKTKAVLSSGGTFSGLELVLSAIRRYSLGHHFEPAGTGAVMMLL